jgi:hypothetical protein
MLLACKSPFCAIASEVPLARSPATIVKVLMAVKSRIFYLLLLPVDLCNAIALSYVIQQGIAP